MSRLLAYRPPLAAAALPEFLEWRALPGVESVVDGSYARSVSTSDGRGVVVLLRLDSAHAHVSLTVPGLDDAPLLAGFEQGARRLLDLDADPQAIDAGLAADPKLRSLVRRT